MSDATIHPEHGLVSARGVPVADPETGKARCTATSKQSGERCRRAPIPGGTTCKIHGSGTAKAQRAAQLRLIDLLRPAVAQHARILTNQGGDVSNAEMLRAIEMVYNRAGLPPGMTIEIDDARQLLEHRIMEMIEARTE